MAKEKTANNKSKSFEETLWDSAKKLRGSVEPSEYKHVVLSLIFLKFASDKFEERRQELIDEGKDKYVEMVEFYTMKNVFYLPLESSAILTGSRRWPLISSSTTRSVSARGQPSRARRCLSVVTARLPTIFTKR